MATRSMYDLQKLTVAPLEQLLDSALAVNIHLIAAQEAGWEVKLSIHEANETLSIAVKRDEWPTDIDGERVS